MRSELTSSFNRLPSRLVITPRNITRGMVVLRTMKSLKLIDTDWPPNATPAEFWKRYDTGEFKK